MPISEDILKCCFFNDCHIAVEPILVSCGAIGCKECIAVSKTQEIECYSCKGKHPVKDLKNTPVIKSIEDMVKSSLNDLFEYDHISKCFTKIRVFVFGRIYQWLGD